MVDYATVLIAVISAGAGLGGSIIAGNFSLKSVRLMHRRDDDALVRSKVEELYAELDRVQALSNVLAARAMKEMNAEVPSGEQFEQINLGRIRAVVSMYFPNCKVVIEDFDKEKIGNDKEIRKIFEDPKADLLKQSYKWASVDFVMVGSMCRNIRERLENEAETIGLSVRGARQVTKIPALPQK